MYVTMDASLDKIKRARCVADIFQLIYFMVMFMFYFVQVHYAPKKVHLPHTPACTYTSHAIISVLLQCVLMI